MLLELNIQFIAMLFFTFLTATMIGILIRTAFLDPYPRASDFAARWILRCGAFTILSAVIIAAAAL